MIKNVGTLDRIIRATIGIAFIYIGFFNDEIISDPVSASIIGVMGILSILVALSRVCPLYSLTNINTRCHKDK